MPEHITIPADLLLRRWTDDPTAMAVYLRLMLIADGQKQIEITKRTFAEAACIPEAKVLRVLHRLQSAGEITLITSPQCTTVIFKERQGEPPLERQSEPPTTSVTNCPANTCEGSSRQGEPPLERQSEPPQEKKKTEKKEKKQKNKENKEKENNVEAPYGAMSEQVPTHHSPPPRTREEAEAVEDEDDTDTDTDTEDPTAESLREYFNAEMQAARATIPRVRGRLRGQRLTMLRARLRENGEDAVREVFRKAARSDFLNGGGRDGWRADFVWLVRPNNFPKVLDGNYDNFTTPPSTPSTPNRHAAPATDNPRTARDRRLADIASDMVAFLNAP